MQQSADHPYVVSHRWEKKAKHSNLVVLDGTSIAFPLVDKKPSGSIYRFLHCGKGHLANKRNLCKSLQCTSFSPLLFWFKPVPLVINIMANNAVDRQFLFYHHLNPDGQLIFHMRTNELLVLLMWLNKSQHCLRQSPSVNREWAHNMLHLILIRCPLVSRPVPLLARSSQ